MLRHQRMVRTMLIVVVANLTSIKNTISAIIKKIMARIKSTITGVFKSTIHSEPANKAMMTEHTRRPEVTQRPMAQLITFTLLHSTLISRLDLSTIWGSDSVWICLSATRTLSEIRPSREDMTFKKPAIPVSKNTGATANSMSWERLGINVFNAFFLHSYFWLNCANTCLLYSKMCESQICLTFMNV